MLPTTSERNASTKVALITGITGQVSFHADKSRYEKDTTYLVLFTFQPAIRK